MVDVANPFAGCLAPTREVRDMELLISFPGGKRVDASFDGHVVQTDQPVSMGGGGTAAAPFDLFLASLGTCAGLYVLAFCQARGIPTEGLGLVERVQNDPATHLPTVVDIEVVLPPGFPSRYRTAVQRAAEHCKVKNMLAAPPEVRVVVASEQGAVVGAA